MPRARSAAAGVAAFLLAAACGRAPVPAPVPPIENARDARAADPCALLSGAQLAALGITGPGAATEAAEGRRCAWASPDHGPDLGITLFVDGGGLATLAANSEPTTSRVRLAGYPALETFTDGGEFCQYDVGVAADQVVMASLERGTPDSCTALQGVLPGVVAGLPALSR
jgi:hypothetical protein